MSNTEQGRVAWIGLRTAKRGLIQPVNEVAVHADTGLVGDHFSVGGPARRQVTLIQQEHLPVVAQLLGMEDIRPEMTRRNILVSGINLLSLEGQQFQISDTVFLCTGPCEPCQRMNSTMRPGALEAMAGHGGIMAQVVQPGTIRVADAVSRLADR